MRDISDDKILELASQDRPITREELGIDAPRTNDGLQILNEGFFSNKISKQNNKSEAYKIVFDDLIQCNLFRGIYDARHGNENFMNGIWTVMECIAQGVSDEWHDKFDKEFVQNMIASEEKYENRA